MVRDPSPAAIARGRKSGQVRRSVRLVRHLDEWVAQEAPSIHELPAVQRRVIEALLRAREAAEADS